MATLVPVAVIILIFMGSPLWAKILLTIANLVIPDPIPLGDEALMTIVTATQTVDKLSYLIKKKKRDD